MRTPIVRAAIAAISAIAIAAASACTEPRAKLTPVVRGDTSVVASLDLSDPTARPGTTVGLSVTLSGPRAHEVASLTATITYDTTHFRYVGELDAPDLAPATRVINPTPGTIRLAAISPTGFTTATIYSLTLELLRPTPQTPTLSITEMHTTDRHAITPATRSPR